MPDLANYAEVQRALQEETAGILQQIPAPSVQLSMPLDGRGARIRASVKPDESANVPGKVEIELDGKRLTIPVETFPDHQDYKAY